MGQVVGGAWEWGKWWEEPGNEASGGRSLGMRQVVGGAWEWGKWWEEPGMRQVVRGTWERG